MEVISSRQSAAGASRANLTTLPADTLAAIAAHLSQTDRAALALTHPSCAAAVRFTRTSCTAHISDETQLAYLCKSVCTHHQALVALAVHWSGELSPKLQNLVLPDTIRRLSIAFVTHQPRAVRFGAPSARGITTLSLSGFNNTARRLNAGSRPWLAALKELPALHTLNLRALQSDAGLEQVTQVRSTIFFAAPNS